MIDFYLRNLFKLLILIFVISSIKANERDEKLIIDELVKYFQSVDTDEDHQLTVDELARWIRKIHNIIIDDNVDTQWANVEKEITEEHTWTDYELSKKETVTWEVYKKRIFEDHLEEQRHLGIKKTDDEIKNEFENIVERFEKRWKLADEDGTGYLVKEEFKFYLHPEESNNETILAGAVEDLKNDLDKNSDSNVSFEEYLQHIKSMSSDEEKRETEFIEVNKENFELNLDKNKNGILDLDEIKDWVKPDYDKYKLEAANLLEQTDYNRDNELQLEELIEGFDRFYNLLPPKFYESLNERNGRSESIKHDEF